MTLVETKQFPPDGWIYREMIGTRYWTNPQPMIPFLDVVKLLAKARANNPKLGLSTDLGDCAKAIGDYTCKRLNDDTRWCEGRAPSAIEQTLKAAKGCGGCGAKKKSK